MRRARILIALLPLAVACANDRQPPDVAGALGALATANVGEPRLVAARAVIVTGRPAVPELVQRLAAPRESTDGMRRAMLARFGAAVPDTTGVFRQPPRPDRKAPADLDWLAELAQLPGDDKGLLDALEIVTILRALAETRASTAAEAILDFAFTPTGLAFRDECGRSLRVMAPHSFPALLAASAKRERDKGSYARYASYQLDRLGKGRPALALASAPNDELAVAMLHAIRDVKHPDAVEAVLQRTDSPSHAVRRAGREAWLAYVTGPPPPPAPKAKRRLPGGQFTPEELPLYLTYRELAEVELRRALTELRGTAPARRANVESMTHELFSLYDDRRAARWDGLTAEAAEFAKAGNWAEVGKRYDRILLEDPTYPRRREFVGGYLELGRSQSRAKSLPDAMISFHKALSIEPEGLRAREAEAELHLARALVDGTNGDDEFAQAIAVAPDLASSEQALHRRTRVRRGWMLYLGAAMGIMAVAIAVVARRKERRP